MGVYKLIQDSDNFDSLLMSREVRPRFEKFGRPLAATWQPAPVETYAVGRAGDFPSLRRDVPVFSERAWHTLKPLIGGEAEALPLSGTREPYYAINVLDIADCLDRARSKIKWLSTGNINSIEKHVFKEGCLEGKHIFKLPETARQEVFVSEEFKQLVESSSLEGLMLRKVA
jgi:hypothetical protein